MYSPSYLVVGRGEVWYDNKIYEQLVHNDTDYFHRDFNQFAAFIIIAATASLILAVVLLIDTFKQCLSNKIRTMLFGILLLLQFTLAVVISIVASTTSNEKAFIENFNNRGVYSIPPQRNFLDNIDDDLDTYHQVAVADTILKWFLIVIPLFIILGVAYNKLAGRDSDAADAPPPPTADRM